MDTRTSDSSLKASSRFYGLMSFVAPFPFLIFMSWFTNLLSLENILAVCLHPATYIYILGTVFLSTSLIQNSVNAISKYYQFSNDTMAEKAQKKILKLPKIIIILCLFMNLTGPQFILLFMDFRSADLQFHFLTMGYAVTMLIGIMFYIPFIRNFEYYGKNVPFNRKYSGMSFTVRNNLVVFFSISAVTIIIFLTINGVIRGHMGELETLYKKVVIKAGVISAIASFVALFNNIILARGIGQRLKKITESMEQLSKGNLKVKKIEILSRDEFGALLDDQNRVIDNLRGSLGTVKKSTDDTLAVKEELVRIADETSSSAVQISASIESVNKQINVLDDNVVSSTGNNQEMTDSINTLGDEITEQSAMVEESTAAITEMIASIDNITSIAHKKAEVSESLMNTAADGESKLDETIQTLNSIHSSIEDIKEITSLIMGIAARTNLLAMNAAIEAAHAGDAGRGFSVVADEIRKLAETSTKSSKKINDNIKEIISHIEKSSQSSDITVQAFHAVQDEVREVVQAFKEIESGVTELKTGGDQILQAITNLRDISVTVKEKADSMLSQTGEVSSSVKVLSRISMETKNASQEISNGAKEIIEATEGLSVRTNNLDQYSSILKESMEKFEI